MTGVSLFKKLCLFFVFILINESFAAERNVLQQQEGGWRWKENFTLSFQGKIYKEADAVHFELDRESKNVQSLLEAFKTHFLVEVLDNEKNWDVFIGLNHGGESIRENLEGVDKKDLIVKWKQAAEKEETWQVFKNGHAKVFEILEENLRRLRIRNIAIAKIGYIDEKEQYKTLNVTDPTAHPETLAVFLSGTGNELVKVLETFKSFEKYKFVIFNEREKGFLRGNLGFILIQKVPKGMPPLPGTLIQRSDTYASAINRYCASYKSLEKQIAEYNVMFAKFREGVTRLQRLPGPEFLTEGLLLSHPPVFRVSRDLSDALLTISEKNSDIQSLVGDFYHSEQLMRLFLYDNLKALLPSQFIERGGLIVLHVHSLNDLCERCAHCLFLESAMSHVFKEERPEVGPKTKPKRDPYGFFEKLNNPENEYSEEGFRKDIFVRFLSERGLDSEKSPKKEAFVKFVQGFDFGKPFKKESVEGALKEAGFDETSDVEKLVELVKTFQELPVVKEREKSKEAFAKYCQELKEAFKRSNRFSPVILASSEVAGVGNRHMCGHDDFPGSEIIVEKFFPLMAFKTIPSFGRLEPLPQHLVIQSPQLPLKSTPADIPAPFLKFSESLFATRK